MAIEYPDKLKASTTGFAIANTRELAGHKQVATPADLLNIPDAWLSPSGDNTNNDAIGQEWYVISTKTYHKLTLWANRKLATGWAEVINLSADADHELTAAQKTRMLSTLGAASSAIIGDINTILDDIIGEEI